MTEFMTSLDAVRQSGGMIEMKSGVLEVFSEASELRLGVGQWPDKIVIKVGSYLHSLERVKTNEANWEIQSVEYASKDGRMKMKVFND